MTSPAIAEQAERFIHAQVNVYTHDLLEPLAAKLAEIAPGGIDTFFFANSGAEITEGRGEARQAGHPAPEHDRVQRLVPRPHAHGDGDDDVEDGVPRRSRAAAGWRVRRAVPRSAGARPGRRDRRALTGLDHLLLTQTAPAETAAMILEPVLGEGGYIPAPQAFLEGLVERCRAHGILFIADEVQSGFGRTGKMFAVEHYGIEPDIICMAKGIASGFPFSALGTRRELDDQWPKGSHGGTYGGNPIGCAAALATIEVMSEPGFLDNVRAPWRAAVRRLARAAGAASRSAAGSRTGADGGDAASPTRHGRRRSSATASARGT